MFKLAASRDVTFGLSYRGAYINVPYVVNKEKAALISRHPLSKIRFHHKDGYLEYEIPKKKRNAVMKIMQLFTSL